MVLILDNDVRNINMLNYSILQFNFSWQKFVHNPVIMLRQRLNCCCASCLLQKTGMKITTSAGVCVYLNPQDKPKTVTLHFDVYMYLFKGLILKQDKFTCNVLWHPQVCCSSVKASNIQGYQWELGARNFAWLHV